MGDATAINESGQVVGGYGYNGGFLYTNGTMHSLGGCAPWDINDAGQVVGTYEAMWGNHAFTYANGIMRDLNDFLPEGSLWVLESATAINNDGWIVGEGTYDGQSMAFLMGPVDVPEPSAVFLLIGALCVVALLRRNYHPGQHLKAA